jgi:hypothetical protein
MTSISQSARADELRYDRKVSGYGLDWMDEKDCRISAATIMRGADGFYGAVGIPRISMPFDSPTQPFPHGIT